jgi:hypothetical protein
VKNLKVLCCMGLIISCISNSFGQVEDSTSCNSNLIHDASAYVDFQFPEGTQPLVTTEVWLYVKKFYFEARYNYEDRQTVSLYRGRSFKIGKNSVFEIIPMLGGALGKFQGVSVGTTMILEAGWIRGFSQNQYSMDLQKTQNNFIFDWSAVAIHTCKTLYIGASVQSFILIKGHSQIYYGPMISIKDVHIAVEGFAYNFWNSNPMWALGVQYFF